MNELQRAGQSGALDVSPNAAAFQQQAATVVDMLRQLGGNPSVVSGTGGSADPLNAPFTLYVDPYIGSDRFVGGAYNSLEATGTDEQIIAQKLRRIELQRLECGYTPSRPFKTINRASIEAAIITSKNWATQSDLRFRVSIVHSGGLQIAYNDPGSSSTSLASWGATKDPTIAELIAFNPVTGGVLLPRGCTVRGEGLEATTIAPNWATPVEDEAADYSNRRAVFKVTGKTLFTEFAFIDKVDHDSSLHLLDPIQVASRAELDAFYSKVNSAVGSSADLSSSLLAARPSEYQIVGPIDQSQSPTSLWDTVKGRSAYVFNVSVISELGMSGLFVDGSKIEGLRSAHCANFTLVSQQRDMRCWQVYKNGGWVTLPKTAEGYQEYIDTAPDNVRRNPARHTRHVAAVNNAYIQKVSSFGIGQSEAVLCDSGSEITDNTGNTTFGGSAALAKGYKGFAFGKDKNWATGRVRVPLNISEKLSNIRRIELGVVSGISSSAITLSSGLAINSETPANPALLESLGYTFASGTRIWIDNPAGDDWRATLSSNAWSSSTPAAIGITAAPLQSGTNAAAGDAVIGRRVYLRRVVDTRTVAERRCSLLLNNTAAASLPQRNAVLQTDPARSGGAIARVLAAGGEEVLIVTSVGTGTAAGAGVTKTSEVTLRRGAPSKTYATGVFYRQGTIVKHAGKHWQAKATFISSGSSPALAQWGETFVHMPSDFNPEDSVTHEAPIITLDTDTSDVDDSTTLGINWATAWTDAGPIRNQYRTGTDYLGAYAFLLALGFSDGAAHAALVPQVAASRDRDPSSALHFPTAPTGGAATGLGNWAVEFRRPSTIRLYNHQWEWAGFGNYSKAMPAAQGDMSEFNKFTYYFTSAAGGRVTPKGSNEDGFEVTPKGLEDIATGSTISAESFGSLGIDDAQRTDFPNGIQVGGTAILADVAISGTVDFSSQSQAKISRPGAARLASIAQLTATGGSAPVATTDASLEASPDAVTIGGLNLWKQAQRLVSLRTGVTTIYVVPDSATAAGQSFNFDGTSATLTLSPIRSDSEVFEAPPLTEATAVTFAIAVTYANAVFSPEETVRYQLANGPYWNSPAAFGHKADVIGAIARFPETNVVSSYTSASTKPTTDVKALHDARSPFLVPCFATGINVGIVIPGQSVGFSAAPLRVELTYGGTVRGVCWLTAAATLADTSNFPSDPIYSAALRSYRSSGVSLASFIDDYLDGAVSSGFSIYGFWSDYNISVGKGILYLRDIVFGAKSPSIQNDTRSFNVWAGGDVEVYSGGIYFLGNTSLTAGNLPKATAKGITVTNALGLLNSQFYIGSAAGSASRALRVGFNPYFSNSPDGAGNTNKNFDTNCIHILDDNGNYGLVANGSATNGTRGAAVSGVIGNLSFGSTIITGGYQSWFTAFTNANKHHGIAGAFGNYSYAIASLTDQPCVGLVIQEGLKIIREPSYNNSLWQMATSGTLLTSNVTLTSAPGGTQVSYDFAYNNAANLKISAFYKGIDVNSGTQILGSLPSNRFFG